MQACPLDALVPDKTPWSDVVNTLQRRLNTETVPLQEHLRISTTSARELIATWYIWEAYGASDHAEITHWSRTSLACMHATQRTLCFTEGASLLHAARLPLLKSLPSRYRDTLLHHLDRLLPSEHDRFEALPLKTKSIYPILGANDNRTLLSQHCPTLYSRMAPLEDLHLWDPNLLRTMLANPPGPNALTKMFHHSG